MDIVADVTRCEGHGRCEMVAPEVFELDEDAVVRVRSTPVPAGLEETALAGVRACPVAALSVREDAAIMSSADPLYARKPAGNEPSPS